MNAIRFDSKLTDQLERELIRQEMRSFPRRSRRLARAGTGPDKTANQRYPGALLLFKGALITGAALFVTITLALQAAARFS